MIYVVTVLPLPHTMPVLNAMQLQRDDLAPWGGWKHTCNLWWWQATVISSFNALGIQAHTERYNWHQEREQNRFCTKRQNWVYSFSKYTPFRSFFFYIKKKKCDCLHQPRTNYDIFWTGVATNFHAWFILLAFIPKENKKQTNLDTVHFTDLPFAVAFPIQAETGFPGQKQDSFYPATYWSMLSHQSRSQSSSAISDVTSPVKLVGKIRPGRLALSRSVPSVLWSLG